MDNQFTHFKNGRATPLHRHKEGATKRNIPIIIGAQVGETSILTRSALTIANAYRATVIAQEGAFATRFLEHDVVDQPLMFGQGGLLPTNVVKDIRGLGFVINDAVVAKIS